MAARHAGFAVVACVHESLIDNLLEAAFLAHPQRLEVHLPLPLPAPAGPVTIEGSCTLLAPLVSLTGGQVHLTVRAMVDARLSGSASAPQDVLVEISSHTTAALTVFVEGDRLQVGIDPTSVVVTDLTLRVVDGSLPSLYGSALTLPQVAAAIQSAIRALPPQLLRTTVDGFPLTTHIAPRQMPCGASLFELPEMFHATLSISRVVPVVRERVLVIGVDVAGITNGDPGALRSLFGDQRPVWVRTGGPDGIVDFDLKHFRGPGNLALSVNPDALDAILRGPVSSASHHAFVDCHVALDGLSVGGDTFSPNLQPQYRIDGLRMRVGVRYYRSTARDAASRLVPAGDGTPVDVTIPIAIHRHTWDGPTAFLSGKADYWYLQAYEPDIDLPFWLSLGLIFIGTALPGAFVPAIALIDGVVPMLLGNITNQVQRSAQSGINGAFSNLAIASGTSLTVPGLESVPAGFSNTWYAMDGEGIDVYTSLHLASAPDTRPDRYLTLSIDGTEVHSGDRWTVAARRVARHVIAVAIAPGAYDPADRDVRVRWEVRRSDTHEVIASQDLPRLNLIATQIGGTPQSPVKLVIDRNDPALLTVPGFEIALRVYRPLQGRTKEIGSATLTLTVEDRLDRSRPYVWWNGWAAGSYKESVLHRTVTPGRCLMVERAPLRAKFQYLDELPFPVADLHLHRGGTETTRDRHLHVACDYCFYGGPDKTTPQL